MFLNIILGILLVGQIPKEYKKYIEDKYPRERVKKFLLGEELPPITQEKDVKVESELSGKPQFFEKENTSTCVFRGVDKEGNIIVEVPDYVEPSKKLKLAPNPLVLDKSGKEITLSNLKEGDWIKVFIDDNGEVSGILKNPFSREEKKW